MLLNPQKFSSSMSSQFGPGQCDVVLSLIFNASIKCAFNTSTLTEDIKTIFPKPSNDKMQSYTPIHCRFPFVESFHCFQWIFFSVNNNSIVYVPQLETKSDFWDVIRKFENNVLSSNDLFTSLPPTTNHNQSKTSSNFEFNQTFFCLGNGSYSSFLDSSASPGWFSLFLTNKIQFPLV